MNVPEPDPTDPLPIDPDRADGPAPELADAPLAIPRRLGDFRIVGELGRGGMGVVFEAEDQTLGRRVALKVLPIAATLQPEQVQRFQLEAQVVARLAHPNILPVFSVGRDQGISFFAMPLVVGKNLAEIIHEMARPLPLGPGPPVADVSGGEDPPSLVELARDPRRSDEFCRAVARLGRQAAAALAHSHEAGVWHRDIKPANLLVEPSGHLWVTDFGLARLADAPGLTRPGDQAGTIRYMSPEQAAGHSDLVDGRSDVYSLGMTLQETLDRRPALRDGGNVRPGPRSHRAGSAALPLRRDHPSLPADLQTILIRATAPRPGDRYATAALLADDLQRFLDREPIRARRLGTGERLRRWADRPERVAEASQSLFWFGVMLTVFNLGSLIGFALGSVRPPSLGRFLTELGIGMVVFNIPMLICGVQALRGRRAGLILGTLVVVHFALLVASSLTGLILLDYGGIARDLGERWPLEMILASLVGFTLSRLAIGIRASRINVPPTRSSPPIPTEGGSDGGGNLPD